MKSAPPTFRESPGAGDPSGGGSPAGRLAASILASPKYAGLDPEFVRGIVERELAKRRSPKEALRAARALLHQSTGAFAAGPPPFEAWLGALREAARGGPEALRGACRGILARHASTRERLGILDRFHGEILEGVPPLRRVLDLACGLHPLSAPWIPLAEGASFLACDVRRDLAAFLGEALPLLGARGAAEARDLTRSCPSARADAAFLLKALPALERLDRSAPARILDALRADVLLVSFPSRTLGGRDKGMEGHHRERFLALAAGRTWEVREFRFPGEIVFRVRK
ncbi:MAG: 16S rRNA methyltransferase [Planctomycetes bacterium]|jgi:16S rRNA (guanine(1405)-N(7))-methyltransferase|nr:16S rRNA methyltransferase [Planctomycetota bacterium]